MTNDKGILIRNIYYMLSYAFLELKRNNYEDIAKLTNISERATRVEPSTINGNILIDGKETQVYRGLPLDDSEYIKNLDEVRLCSGGAADDFGFGKEDETFTFEG